MKTTKIIMGLALAAAVALTGCKQASESIGDVNFDYESKANATTGAEATAKVNFENPTDEYARGMLTFNNKKKGITARIVMQDLTSNGDNPGLMGLVFNMTKNKDGTLNFCVLGARNYDGKARAYISYYKNISEDNFSKSDFGASDGDRKDIKDWFIIPGVTRNSSTNELAYFVEIEALKSATDDVANLKVDNEEVEDIVVDPANAYKVYFYDDATVNMATFKNISNKKHGAGVTGDITLADGTTTVNKDGLHAKAVASVDINRADIGVTTLKAVEAKMGFYANVYTRSTLKGEWQVADIKHDPNVAKSAAEESANTLGITLE